MSSAVFTNRSVAPERSLRLDDRSGVGFSLLILTVTTLFVRPADLIPSLDKLPIYQGLITLCLLVGMRSIIRQLGQIHLHLQPVTVCVVGLIASAAMSHLAHGFIWGARTSAWEIAKLASLFLLIVGLVNTTDRLLLFLKVLVLAISTTAALAWLDRIGVIPIAALQSIRDRAGNDPAVFVDRIRGTGIFHDPNDFGLVLVMGFVLSVGFLARPRIGWPRLLWLLPALLLLYVLSLTHSRGAFLSLICAFPAAVLYRKGRRSNLFVAVLGILMVIVLAFSGRMTDLSAIQEGTGQSRLQIWSDSLVVWKRNPIFGLGEGLLVEELGVVSHNSYIHCFAEMGVLGGCAFVACFLAAGWGLWKTRETQPNASQQRERYLRTTEKSAGSTVELQRDDRADLGLIRMFVFATVVAYAGGMLALSRQFIAPTFLVLGIAATTQHLPRAGQAPWQLSGRFAVAVVLVSVAVLAASHLTVQLFIN